jgi:indole-3-glycerol phosphate synthase
MPQLKAIIALKQQHLLERKSKTPIQAVRALASLQKRPQPVLSTITHNAPVVIIGQIKYKLAQTGLLTDTYDPVSAALRYTQSHVDAISLFTDETGYQGGLDDMVLVSRAVEIPVISEDYILDEYQIVESRAAGASALVLSAAVADPPTLRSLVSATHRNRMTAIVEVRSREELEYAVSLSPYVIGLGSRDSSLRSQFGLIQELRPHVPENMRVMPMPALKTLDEVAAVIGLGIDAMLVRETILQDPNQSARLRELARRPHTPSE